MPRRRTGRGEAAPPTAVPPDDPDVGLGAPAEPPPPTRLEPGTTWVLLPGTELHAVDGFPSHHRGRIQVCLGGAPRLLVLDGPHRRHTFPLARPGADEPGRVTRIVVTTVARPRGHHDEPARLLGAYDGAGTLLAKLDTSGTWPWSVPGVRRLCQEAGIACEVEHARDDAELMAHEPELEDPMAAFAQEHPLGEDVREVGLAVFYGVGASVLLLSTGVVLIVATPVDWVVAAAALAGGVVAAGLSAYAHLWWRRRATTVPRSAAGPSGATPGRPEPPARGAAGRGGSRTEADPGVSRPGGPRPGP